MTSKVSKTSTKAKKTKERKQKNQKMGEKGKKKGFVIGPKGDEISEYEYKRLEKIRRNKERLESLGLDKAKPRSRKSKRSTSTDLKHNHRDENSSNAIFPARRSKRLSGKKPELNSSDLDLVEPPPNNPPTPILKPRKRARIYNTKNYRILTEKERQSLKNVNSEDFIEDLIYFMQSELHNSDQNCRNVRKTLTRLVRGEGVPHKRSDLKGNVFQKGFKVG